MKKTIMIIMTTAMITGIISIYGAYAATNYAISANKIDYSDNANLGVADVQAAIDGTCTKFSSQLKDMRKSMYPVGSVYLSTSLSTASAVESLLGGTWETYGKGKTLVGVDTEKEQYNSSNKEGGNNSVTLSTSQIPSLSVSGTTETKTSGSTGSGYSIGYNTTGINNDTTTTIGSAHIHSNFNAITGYIGVRGSNDAFMATSSSASGAFSITGYSSAAYQLERRGTTLYPGYGGFNFSATPSMNGNSGAHTHTYTNRYANSISGVAAHTHSIPSLSVSASYTNSNVSSINVQDEYITVYMYKRTA